MRAIWFGVICALVAAPGCLPHLGSTEKPPHAKGDGLLMPRQAPPVTPDQVTEGNARHQLRALREELDRARGEPPAALPAEGSRASRGTE